MIHFHYVALSEYMVHSLVTVALVLDDSLFYNGAFSGWGSLVQCGALEHRGSLSFDDSLAYCGAYLCLGSLGRSGALSDSGSLY
jgi:hypothetical protein